MKHIQIYKKTIHTRYIKKSTKKKQFIKKTTVKKIKTKTKDHILSAHSPSHSHSHFFTKKKTKQHKKKTRQLWCIDNFTICYCLSIQKKTKTKQQNKQTVVYIQVSYVLYSINVYIKL